MNGAVIYLKSFSNKWSFILTYTLDHALKLGNPIGWMSQ